jgi:hypothetical protein
MAEILVSARNLIYFTQSVSVANKKTVPFYGSVKDADNYFFASVNYRSWDSFENEDKWRAIAHATRIIDRLNFIDAKANADQPLQFPRTGATTVPVQIEQACYEVALRLLEGIDPDMEAQNASLRSQGFAIAKSEHDRSFLHPWIKAGIPCQSAWVLLVPYLRDPNVLLLRRSS